jgi:hypothetical protein
MSKKQKPTLKSVLSLGNPKGFAKSYNEKFNVDFSKKPNHLPSNKPTRSAISLMEALYKIEPGIVKNISKFHNKKHVRDLEPIIELRKTAIKNNPNAHWIHLLKISNPKNNSDVINAKKMWHKLKAIVKIFRANSILTILRNDKHYKNLNYILNNKELHFIIKDLNVWMAQSFLNLSLYQLRHLRKIKAKKSKRKTQLKQNEKKYKNNPPKSSKSFSRFGDLY